MITQYPNTEYLHSIFVIHLILVYPTISAPTLPRFSNLTPTTTTKHNQIMAQPKLRASLLIISETAAQDPSTDKCIPALEQVFEALGNDGWEVVTTKIIPDDVGLIQRAVLEECFGEVNLIVTSGGTGFAVKDVTPEVCVLVS